MDIGLDKLFPELSHIENFIDSDEKIDPVMDFAVGELPDYLKAIHTLLKLSEQSMRGARDVNRSNEDILKHMCEWCESAEKHELLREMFKVFARNEFNLWADKCCSQLGVRQGFLLVKPLGHRPKRMLLSGTPEEIFQKMKDSLEREHFCQN